MISIVKDKLRLIFDIDWVLFTSVFLISIAGLITMNSFGVENNAYFDRQVMWIGVSVAAFFFFSMFDYRLLRRTSVIVTLFLLSVSVLFLLFMFGSVAKGAQSWFQFGGLAFQPSDPIKIVLILLLAKYFTRRHVEIAHIRHILVSGIYAFILFILVFLQPDFGSAIIIFFVWFGMVLVSGISKKHLATVFVVGLLVFGGLWGFVFQDYQKDRIITFVNPLTDIRGAGYNAYQSTIAVGSGGLLGKGVGYGTQSKLKFLPEYETDFIFAAFAEEWGFVGGLILLGLFAVVIWRILHIAAGADSNFEMLFAMGLVVLFTSHFIIHVGMNIGLLPVTGITLPFMSYGGSHLLTELSALGVLMGMRRYGRGYHKDAVKNEFLGLE